MYLDDILSLAQAIADSMPKAPVHTVPAAGDVDANALFRLSYGLFVLTAREGDRDNGCIINTAAQVTDLPKRISVTVNKANLTHDMILNTGVFNLSVLTTDTPMKVFEHFGFASGRDTDKFAGTEKVRSSNGLTYLPEYANAVISAKIVARYDYGTHMLFVADVTEAKILSGDPSATNNICVP